MNIYFYEVTRENYQRYVHQVAARLADHASPPRLFFIRDRFIRGDLAPPSGPARDLVTVVDVRDLKDTVAWHHPDVFVCFGHRLPDVYYTYWFKRRGARAAQVQHGLYINFFPKTVRGFLSHRSKTRYLLYLLRLLVSRMPKKLRTIGSVLRKDLVLQRFKPEIADEAMSDRIFVWGRYWQDWYRKQLFYKSDRVGFTICGNFDALLLQDEPNLLRDKRGVAYICQTLVEDGRMERSMFLDFVSTLRRFVEREEEIRLYIRPHPRTNLDLYGGILDHPRVEATRKFPYLDRYIGHYSGLLSICLRPDSSVVLVNFPGHQIPDFYRDVATAEVGYLDEIQTCHFEGRDLDHSGRYQAEDYWQAVEDPYAVIADGLLELGGTSDDGQRKVEGGVGDDVVDPEEPRPFGL